MVSSRRLVTAIGLALCCSVAFARELKATSSAETDCSPVIDYLRSRAEMVNGELTVYGDKQPFGEHYVRTYMKLFEGKEKCAAPKAVGLEVSASTWDNPPLIDTCNNQPGCDPGPPATASFLHFFPEAEEFSPYKTLQFNWDPSGHEPHGIYTVPHFDFHWYRLNQSEIEAIDFGDCFGISPDGYYKAQKPIPRDCFPQGGQFTNIGAIAPQMGNHYMDLASPEFTSKPSRWNETFLYGGYDGEMVFVETMITLKRLQKRPNWCKPIPSQPQKWAKDGFVGTTYCLINFDNITQVEVTDFVYVEGGCGNEIMAVDSYWSNAQGIPLPPECSYETLE